MAALNTERVLSVHHWNDSLFSFTTTRDRALRFDNGQFVMIGLPGDNGGKPLMRAYSIVSANYEEYLEFFSIKVPDGPLTSRLQHLKEGDEVLVSTKPTGTLLISDVHPGRNLYLLSTGTGLAPFLSIARDPETYERFERVIVVHGVRYVDDLAYDALLTENLPNDDLLGELIADRLFYYPIVSREPFRNEGRLTDAIDSGADLLKISFFVEDSQRLDAVIAHLDTERRRAVIDAAAAEDLWPEVIATLRRIGPEARHALAELALAQRAEILDSLIRAAAEHDLWPSLLTIGRELPDDEDEKRRGERIARLIETTLRGEERLPEPVSKKTGVKGRMKAFNVEADALVNNSWSDDYTVLEISGLDRFLGAFGVGFRAQIHLAQLVAVQMGQLGRQLMAPGGGEGRLDGPEFLFLEDLDLGFAFADQAQRHRLHTARRPRARQLAPQDRRQIEADQIVECPARQIGVDQFLVQVAGMVEGVPDRVLGDFVEHHAFDVDAAQQVLFVQDFLDMPRNRLALAVGVGRQIQFIGALHRIGDGLDVFFRPGVDFPVHFEIGIGPDRAVFRRQVADMAVAGQNRISGAQVLINCLCLGRAFNDDNVGHTRLAFSRPASVRPPGRLLVHEQRYFAAGVPL